MRYYTFQNYPNTVDVHRIEIGETDAVGNPLSFTYPRERADFKCLIANGGVGSNRLELIAEERLAVDSVIANMRDLNGNQFWQGTAMEGSAYRISGVFPMMTFQGIAEGYTHTLVPL